MLIRAVARRGGSSLEAAWSFLRKYAHAPILALRTQKWVQEEMSRLRCAASAVSPQHEPGGALVRYMDMTCIRHRQIFVYRFLSVVGQSRSLEDIHDGIYHLPTKLRNSAHPIYLEHRDAEAFLLCRSFDRVFRKLGNDEEADTRLGELLSGIGSLLASEAAVGQVTVHIPFIFETLCTQDSPTSSRDTKQRKIRAHALT